MNPKAIISQLLSSPATAAPFDIAAGIADLKRRLARLEWGRGMVAKCDAAQRRADAAWARFDAEHADLDEDERDALPPPPEQAELERLLDQVDAVIERGEFPRGMYFGGI